MSAGITFRCTCEHCGAIFFSPDRNASACMKCAKRHRIRVEPVQRQASEAEDDFLAAALAAPTPPPATQRPTAPARSPATPPRAPTTSVPPPAPPTARPRVARAPRSTELTDEKRAEVLRLYAEYEGRGEVALRHVHAEIAEKTHLARAVVARVIADQRTPPPSLTDDQRDAIVARYREYVRAMERPPGGRRSRIARDLGVGRQQVVSVVREWAGSQPSITDLKRDDLFRIERAYLAAAASREPYDGLARRVAHDLGYTDWQVERWMDMLHDGDFSDVEDPPEELRQSIIQAYREYLQGDGPPPRSLHVVFGERFGITPRQVHKVLVEYRLGQRHEAFGF